MKIQLDLVSVSQALAANTFGPINLEYHGEGTEAYKIHWLSRLTNVKTSLYKLNRDRYMVNRIAPSKVAVSPADTTKIFKSPTVAALYFLMNVETFRVKDEAINLAQKNVVDFIQQQEKILLRIPRPSKRHRYRDMLGKPVLVGDGSKKRSGTLISLLPNHEAKVLIHDARNPDAKRVETFSTKNLWID